MWPDDTMTAYVSDPVSIAVVIADHEKGPTAGAGPVLSNGNH
jgi:hypothetical protein